MNPPTTSTPLITSDEKIWIVLSHLSVLLGVGILLPLIVYLVKKDESAAVAFHAKEALNFHISLYIYMIVSFFLVFILIGFLLLILLFVGGFIFSIIAAVRGADGQEYRYPLTIRFIK